MPLDPGVHSIETSVFAASGVFYLMRKGAVSDLEDACGSDFHCSEAERSTYDRARTYNTLTNVALGVGVAGVGVGTVLLVSKKSRPTPSAPAARTSSPSTLGMTFHPTGVALVGRF